MNKKYSEDWDAWYDADTGEWLEFNCDDKECPFCKNRPERAPIEGKSKDD